MTTQAYHTDDDQLAQEHDHSIPENNLTEPDAELAMAEAPPTQPDADLAMADTDLAVTGSRRSAGRGSPDPAGRRSGHGRH